MANQRETVIICTNQQGVECVGIVSQFSHSLAIFCRSLPPPKNILHVLRQREPAPLYPISQHAQFAWTKFGGFMATVVLLTSCGADQTYKLIEEGQQGEGQGLPRGLPRTVRCIPAPQRSSPKHTRRSRCYCSCSVESKQNWWLSTCTLASPQFSRLMPHTLCTYILTINDVLLRNFRDLLNIRRAMWDM